MSRALRLAVVVACAAVAVTVGVLQPVVAAQPNAPATTVHLVSPLDPAGHLRRNYQVTATRSGYCWVPSFYNGRAYRCMENDFIQDPCWKETGRNSVVCPGMPWSHRVTRISLTQRLPATDAPSSALWGMRLGGGLGLNCYVSTGAGGWIGHRHISFYCPNGWVLLDTPDRRPAAWTILTAKKVGTHYELRGRKTLTDAWRPVVR